MTYRFECRCGKKLEAGDEDLGEEIRCPACGSRVLLPFKPDGEPDYVSRQPLARVALILGLLPVLIIIYAAVETAAYGSQSPLGQAFRVIGAVIWLGQVATVILSVVALKDIRRASESGGFLQGEREATVALVLGAVWLAFFAFFLVYFFVRMLAPVP
jgi:DNA-directed RNA polymerase subunit RPC12/RpoP